MSKPTANRKTRRRPAFTLIELLVVISIISLLMSIMTPALNGAREHGKRIHCLANLRTLTYGWTMFAIDHDDEMCSPDTNWDVPPASHWVADGPDIATNHTGGTLLAIQSGVLWPYVGREPKVYKCKSDSTDLLRSYSLSHAMGGRRGRHGIYPFAALTDIPASSGKAVFIDAGVKTGVRWIQDSFCCVERIDADPPKWFVRDAHNISARHGDGCNISFADGHCEYYKYADPRTVQLADWQIDPAPASPGNPDLEHFVQLLGGNGPR